MKNKLFALLLINSTAFVLAEENAATTTFLEQNQEFTEISLTPEERAKLMEETIAEARCFHILRGLEFFKTNPSYEKLFKQLSETHKCSNYQEKFNAIEKEEVTEFLIQQKNSEAEKLANLLEISVEELRRLRYDYLFNTLMPLFAEINNNSNN